MVRAIIILKNELCIEMNYTCEYIIFIFFTIVSLTFLNHRKETFFPRQLTLALMGEIVCPLLISLFSNMWLKKKYYGILKQITEK